MAFGQIRAPPLALLYAFQPGIKCATPPLALRYLQARLHSAVTRRTHVVIRSYVTTCTFLAFLALEISVCGLGKVFLPRIILVSLAHANKLRKSRDTHFKVQTQLYVLYCTQTPLTTK